MRLSIIDLASGRQPISNEDGTIWIVFTGAIFNYLELREDLAGRGHRFSTARVKQFYSPEFGARLNGYDAIDQVLGLLSPDFGEA